MLPKAHASSHAIGVPSRKAFPKAENRERLDGAGMAAPRGNTRPPAQMPPSGATATRARPWWLSVGSVLWALLPLVTLGLLSPVLIIHAAAKLRRVWLWLFAAAYVGVAAYAFANLPSVDDANYSAAENLSGGLILLLMLGGTLHAFLLRGRVFPRPQRIDPAVADALAGRQRREDSRSLAENDPALARELRIGRPDLPREYEDGGLVDVNHVPPGVLVNRLGFSTSQAAQAVQRRTSIGGFSNVEELGIYCDLPPKFAEGLSDRVLFMP